MQEALSEQIVRSLDALNEVKNHLVEAFFLGFYGAPFVQASVGLRTVRPYAKPKAERDVQIEQERKKRLLALQSKVEEGGLAEATVRGVLYVMRGEGGIDEREFACLQDCKPNPALCQTLGMQVIWPSRGSNICCFFWMKNARCARSPICSTAPEAKKKKPSR
jgi:hypothetical protein